MRRVVRFLRLPVVERRLTIEAALTLTLACALLKAMSFARVMCLLGLHETNGAAGHGVDASAARAVARALTRVSRNVPFRAACLPQAVAAALMLRRRGLVAEVHFGVAKLAGVITAHAWSRCGDMTVSGGTTIPLFSPIAVFRTGMRGPHPTRVSG